MPKALKLVLRTIIYIIRTLLILALVAGALWFAFETAMNISNIYILTTDGLQKRANVALLGRNEELEKYFSERFLENDRLLTTNRFGGLGVTSFDQKVRVEWAFAYPWDEKGTATVVERVLILNQEAPAAGEAGGNAPVWEDGRYELTFVKNAEGRWYIDEMLLTEKPEPSNTLPLLTLPPGYVTPSPSPTPSLTPSPTPPPSRRPAPSRTPAGN